METLGYTQSPMNVGTWWKMEDWLLACPSQIISSRVSLVTPKVVSSDDLNPPHGNFGHSKAAWKAPRINSLACLRPPWRPRFCPFICRKLPAPWTVQSCTQSSATHEQGTEKNKLDPDIPGAPRCAIPDGKKHLGNSLRISSTGELCHIWQQIPGDNTRAVTQLLVKSNASGPLCPLCSKLRNSSEAVDPEGRERTDLHHGLGDKRKHHL